MKKKFIALILALLMICAATVSVSAEGTGASITASYGSGTVTFSGTVTSDVIKAVAVVLFDPSGNQMAMTTCAVTLNNTFSGSITIGLTSSGTYTVKAANYTGGEFFANASFKFTASPQPPYDDSSDEETPALDNEIDSGETTTKDNIEELISAEESLTVVGEDGAKAVFDTKSLEGISQQADGNVEINIEDVSDEYQETHPGKLIFSLTVKSGDNIISDFGGSVTIYLPYELKEGENPDDVKVWHLKENGVMIPISCKYDPVTKLVSFTISHFSVYMVGVASPWENIFSDVLENDWFYYAVKFVHENGLMAGTGDNAFSPRLCASRGMIVTILHRLEGSPAAGENTFSDVAAGKWYTDAVAWASGQGIVKGYGDGNFGPEDTITREQMAVILMNYAEFKGYDVSKSADLSEYADAASISSWAEGALSWANANALIQGDGTNLMPAGNAERSQVAVILQKFIENIVK